MAEMTQDEAVANFIQVVCNIGYSESDAAEMVVHLTPEFIHREALRIESNKPKLETLEKLGIKFDG